LAGSFFDSNVSIALEKSLAWIFSTLLATSKLHSACLLSSFLAISMYSGYISSNSKVSPETAVFRFSIVVFVFPIILRWFRACTVSASAAALKSLAICGIPSFSAFLAKAKYVLLAWDSPENAFFRFSEVLFILNCTLEIKNCACLLTILKFFLCDFREINVSIFVDFCSTNSISRKIVKCYCGKGQMV